METTTPLLETERRRASPIRRSSQRRRSKTSITAERLPGSRSSRRLRRADAPWMKTPRSVALPSAPTASRTAPAVIGSWSESAVRAASPSSRSVPSGRPPSQELSAPNISRSSSSSTGTGSVIAALEEAPLSSDHREQARNLAHPFRDAVQKLVHVAVPFEGRERRLVLRALLHQGIHVVT